MYENIKQAAGQVGSGFNVSLASFLPNVSPLQTDILGSIMPKLQMPDFQNGVLGKTPNINRNYSEFNANTKYIDTNIAPPTIQKQNFGQLDLDTSSPSYQDLTQQQQNAKTPGLIRHDDGSLGFTRGAITNPEERIESVDSTNSIGQQPVNSQIINTLSLRGIENTGPSAKELRGLAREQKQAARKADRIARRDTNGDGTVSAGEFMNSGAGQAVSAVAGLVGGAVNVLGNSVGQYADRPTAQQLDETQEAVRSGIYGAVSAIPGWGPLISAGLQITDGLGKMLGSQMSSISKDAAEDAGLNRGLNNVVATIPGVGSILGAFAQKSDEFDIDRSRLANVGSAYDMSTFDSAEDLSGGKFLGQTSKVNSFIQEQNRKRDIMTGISDVQRMRKEGASSAAADLAQQNRNRYGGITGQQFAIGKEGMKMPKLNWARNLLAKFKDGGKLGQPGIESNVIVEGAYHAHKNHLDEINPELSDMTPKGIPVATEDPDGVKTQVAEIEVGELILTKELTEKLEALYKDGSDEAAIQAGMLFAEEIIDNTVDNKGGVIDADNI